jgi:CRISPR-associated endonuclease/helicase Cas3
MNNWGRIFFIYGNDKLITVYGQPLSNHSGNCRTLLEQFDPRYFDDKTRHLLFKAVDRHDEGKKETFRIYEEKSESNSTKSSGQGKKHKQGKQKSSKENSIVTAQEDKQKIKLCYSFAGHRFRVTDDDPYVSALIRAHHEFSVQEINRSKSQISSPDLKKRFPNDLYLLCMVDQIEAELAVKTIEKKDSVPRTFMEFSTHATDDTCRSFTVIPWPFATDVFDLSFEIFELPHDCFKSGDVKEIEKAFKEVPISDFKKDLRTIHLSGENGNEY